MKSTKNCSGTTKSDSAKNVKKSGGAGAKKTASKSSKSSNESDSDPAGSYTGNPLGWGKFAQPVQDVDDL